MAVLKFGGTSLYPRHMKNIPPPHDEEVRRDEFYGIKMAARHTLLALEKGHRPVVVVSALGRKPYPYATDSLLSLAESVGRSIDSEGEPISSMDRDMLLCCGELISTALVSYALNLQGQEAVPLTGGQAGIITDDYFGEARILAVEIERLERLLSEGKIPVVAGFQGMTRKGELTTIGRGGSDTTAVALGAALKQAGHEVVVEIYTDVEGVMTADPQVVEDARLLPEVTYEELCEMAHTGAGVVHARCAEIAMQYEIPLRIRGMFSDSEGTLVCSSSKDLPPEKWGVRAVTFTKEKFTFFRIFLEEVRDKLDAERRIYQVMADNKLSMLFVSVSRHTTDFAVAQELAPKVEELLRNLISSEEALSNARVETVPDCCMVSVVGPTLKGVWGVMDKIAQALFPRNIRVVQFADSPYSTTCLVPSHQAEEAVRALHEAFQLHVGS